jgi:hypothetical protein
LGVAFGGLIEALCLTSSGILLLGVIASLMWLVEGASGCVPQAIKNAQHERIVMSFVIDVNGENRYVEQSKLIRADDKISIEKDRSTNY